MNEKQKILNFSDYRSFLANYLLDKKEQRKDFSIGMWAKSMELSSTSSLSRILKGDREPGAEMTEKFCHYFKFKKKEKEYFEHLVLLEKTKDDHLLKDLVITKLKKLNPHKSFHVLNHEVFMAVSRWYHYAIREMVNLPDFKEDAKWIGEKLIFKVSLEEIKKAIEVLLNVGLLARNESGQLVQTEPHIEMTNDIVSDASRINHSQNLDNAKIALEKVDILAREFNSVCFNMKGSDLEKIKEDIRAFKREMINKYESPEGDHTYQLQLQLFPFTQVDLKTYQKS